MGPLDALYVGIRGKKVNWILDMDLKGFFDNIDKEHLMEMVERRIADTRVLRLIRKWLNAGVIEDGEWSETEKGTPQGSVISPLLANIYLHYVLDQWTDQWRQSGQGDVIIVRYADDAVIGFQHEYEAKKFLKDLREQLGKYGLELNEDKTRLIRFGRFARQNRDERGEGKPESFTFWASSMSARRTVWGDSKSGALPTALDGGRNCRNLSSKSAGGCTTRWRRSADG